MNDSLVDHVEGLAQKYGRVLGYATVAVLMAYLWIPIAVVTIMSFSPEAVLSFPPESLSVKWYETLVNDQAAIDAILTSVKISLIATPATVCIATMISYAVDRYVFRGKRLLQLLVTLPLIIPLIVTGIAMTMFFGLVGIGSGFWPIVVGHTIKALPFATLIILPTLYSFDRRLEEASMDLGADEFETFVKVTLPNIYPGVLAGGLMAFTMSFNEFVLTYFLKGSTIDTLPTWIWSKLRHRATPEVNAASVLFLVVAIVLILVAVSLTHVERIATQEE
ncbi:ABC transporter permease [Halorussus halobius]|uniref:ABC transporter permease n=1 Tax=Halorussus halobius TaxID=1710537 RepID=UPI001092FB1F|nr:ABC transporter permease [Halorussus halobius]